MAPPRKKKKLYNAEFNGVYGEFGSGADLRAVYIQSTIRPGSLGQISLISDIRGSERWPIRDLFQRDVDQERITEELYPYVASTEKIKFFNPLTLTVLPMDVSKMEVQNWMPPLSSGELKEDEFVWDVLTWGDFFRLRWVRGQPEYAKLEWNDLRSSVVAIDGQHRLSALKRLWAAPKGPQVGLHGWSIPIVVVTFRPEGETPSTRTVLSVVRNIFVDINTQAHRVSAAREVLLSDGSVNALATQELVEAAHANDLVEPQKRLDTCVPLLFYDWRGHERERKPVRSAAAVKSVVEVKDWFSEYILGDDLAADQERALGIEPTDPLKQFFLERERDRSTVLDFGGSDAMRARLGEEVLPAVAHLLETFSPYQEYIAALRELEAKYRSGTDLEQHAFDHLRFGGNYGGIDATANEVERLEEGLVGEIVGIKAQHLGVGSLLSHDVGMRGVMYAFGELIFDFDYPDWGAYSRWFVAALNRAYRAGWLELERPPRQRKYFLHVVENQNGTVVHYRLNAAEKAFGPFLSLLVAAYGSPLPGEWQVEDWPAVSEDLCDQLLDTILRGYRGQMKAELRDLEFESEAQRKEAIEGRAVSAAQLQMRDFRAELRKIGDSET